MLLPVVTRELRIRARLPSTAYTRMAAAVVLLAVTAPTAASILRPGGPPGAGSFLFQFISWVLLLFAFFEGVRASAGVISDERRDGTLGLLFLTDLSPIDILLGKLAGTGLTTFLALLATVPVLSVAVLVGGVTGGEVFRGSVALINALLLALAAGLWASARAPDTLAALLGAIGVLIAATTVPPALDFALQYFVSGAFNPAGASLGLVSPALCLSLAADGLYASAPLRFWCGQALQPLASVALVIAAGARLRRTWRTEATPSVPGAATPTAPAREGPARPAATAETTVAAGLGTRLHLDRWIRILVGLALLPVLASWIPLVLTSGATAAMTQMLAMQAIIQIPAVLAGFAGMTLLTYLAVRSLADARHSGELELLLTTPLGDRELVRVLWHQMRRLVRALTLVSALNALAQIAAYTLFNQYRPTAGSPLDNPLWQIVLWRLGGIVHAWLGNAALVWVGFWFGLSRRRPLAAVGWTFGLVGILTPTAVQMVGVAVMLVCQWAGQSAYSIYLIPQVLGPALGYYLWIRWARQRLSTSFRATAAGTP